MATIMDQTREFSECPWCHTPGRLFMRDFVSNGQMHAHYFIACPNKNCKIKVRTKMYSTVDMNNSAAVNMAINDWEAR